MNIDILSRAAKQTAREVFAGVMVAGILLILAGIVFGVLAGAGYLLSLVAPLSPMILF